MSPNLFPIYGYCPICEKAACFRAHNDWLRDFFVCLQCGSVPCERAIIKVIKEICPDFKNLKIHESSPSPTGASRKLREECPHYLDTQYFPNIERGLINEGYRNENLEKLTFPDESIDLHFTQDEFEHILNPSFAFRCINKTLSGGCHIFTVPLVNKHSPTEIRAELRNGQVHHSKHGSFHGNPIIEKKP